MEEDIDDLDNLFDDYGTTNEPQVEQTNSEYADANEAQAPERVPVPKRVIRNPRLKFNPDRLCGERGIPVLVDHFKDVKFKGKGHEEEDLNKLMSSMEHWCHRLFPKMKFDDCLRQIEKLGKKRPVQTCLRKIRLDMPILSNDFVHDDEEEHEEPENGSLVIESPPQNAFDSLLSNIPSTSQSNLFFTPMNDQSGNVLGTSFSFTLTDEQRKRMEYNKTLATERRRAAMLSDVAASITNAHSDQPSLILPIVETGCNGNGGEILKSLPFTEYLHSMSCSNLPANSDVGTDGTHTQKAEELGLDDLVDLVDEEDVDSLHVDKKISNHTELSDRVSTGSFDSFSAHNHDISFEGNGTDLPANKLETVIKAKGTDDGIDSTNDEQETIAQVKSKANISIYSALEDQDPTALIKNKSNDFIGSDMEQQETVSIDKNTSDHFLESMQRNRSVQSTKWPLNENIIEMSNTDKVSHNKLSLSVRDETGCQEPMEII